MKSVFCDTLRNSSSQYKSTPQKSLDLIEYIEFVDKMEKLLFGNIFLIIKLSTNLH